MNVFLQLSFFIAALIGSFLQGMKNIKKIKNYSSYFNTYKNLRYPMKDLAITSDSGAPLPIAGKKHQKHSGFKKNMQKHTYSMTRSPFNKTLFFLSTGGENTLIKRGNSTITALEHPELAIIPEYFPEDVKGIKIPHSINSKKTKKTSLPFQFQRDSFAFSKFNLMQRKFSTQTKPKDDLSLSGEAASLMNPKNFKILLNSNGMTVADSVRLDCEKNTQKGHNQIRKIANLSDLEWQLAQNMMSLKEQWLKRYVSENYNERNIIFENPLHPFIVRTIKETLKKANIPFKVVVSFQENVEYAAAVGIEFGSNGFPFACYPELGTVNLIDADVTMHLHLNAQYWNEGIYPVCEGCNSKNEQCSVLQSILAHETVHLSLVHPLERLHLIWYLENIKKLKASDIEKCLEIKERLQEYQADVLPLADPFYAKAQKHRFATHKNIEGSSMNIPNKLGYKLASLAVELHDIK